MATKVNPTPAIPTSIPDANVHDLVVRFRAIVQGIITEFSAHARRLNKVIHSDGSEGFTGPFYPKLSTVALLPSPSPYSGALIMVSDDAIDGMVLAYSDGVGWIKLTPGGAVS